MALIDAGRNLELTSLLLLFMVIVLYSKIVCGQYPDVPPHQKGKNVLLIEEEYLAQNNWNPRIFEPWTFQESAPSVDIFNQNQIGDELAWSASAGELIKLLDPKLYNRLQAPGLIHGKTTKVDVVMYVESMSTFRAQTMDPVLLQDFDLDIYFMMAWYDKRLMHNNTFPILLTDINLADFMWFPDLYFVNAKFSYMQRVTTPNFMVVVHSDGFVTRTVRVEVTLACTLDLRDFPMDEQTCPILIQSYAYVRNVVKLFWHSGDLKPIHFNPDIKINDMDRTAVTNDTCDSYYPLFRGGGYWSCLKGRITMKRILRFYVFQMYIPGTLMVVISWLSFWLDIRASPARISLTITSLLTLATMSNGNRQELPRVPYLKASDIWFLTCLGFVFSVLLEYAIVSWFLSKHSISIDKSLKPEKSCEKCHCNSSTTHETPSVKPSKNKDWEYFAKLTDNISKILFPVCFIIFIITYVSVFYFN